VLFYVQHLLGIGHVMRAARLARAWSAAGLEVTLVRGGMPAAGLDLGTAGLVQLPPLRAADDRFSALVDEDGGPVDDAWKAARRDRLLGHFAALRPDALVIEMYPFGRRQMRFELLPLLDAAAAAVPRPLVISSVRDILQTGRKPGRAAEAADLVRRHFDAVLVHGDPSLVRFEETFLESDRIADRLHYTGYVAGPRPPAAARREGVLVSAGGGAVGQALIEAALAARPRSRLAAARWRILVGHGTAANRFAALAAGAPAGVEVERSRADFPELLAAARLSISQGGYNTVMDVLNAAVPAVIVPFAGAGETEQTLRAERLAARGAVRVVREDALSAAALARAIDAAAEVPPAALDLDMEGAATSARLLGRWLDARRGERG